MAGPDLVCPQCGGKVRPEEEDAFVACEFCGSSMYLDPGLAVRHWILPATLRRENLPGFLGSWLQEREALGRPVSVSTRLLYVPFWVISQGGRTAVKPAVALLVHDLDRFSLPSG